MTVGAPTGPTACATRRTLGWGRLSFTAADMGTRPSDYIRRATYTLEGRTYPAGWLNADCCIASLRVPVRDRLAAAKLTRTPTRRVPAQPTNTPALLPLRKKTNFRGSCWFSFHPCFRPCTPDRGHSALQDPGTQTSACWDRLAGASWLGNGPRFFPAQ